jgi:tRNA-dihydrouridine synthase B
LINSLSLGTKAFPVNLIQGPLAGVSCAPFRFLTWQYGRPAYSCTEMISCKTLLNQPLWAQQRFIRKHAEEGPVCFQLAGSDPVELAEATKKVTDYGADLVDLNCGCPVKKIRSKGAGSSLLTEPLKLYKLITAMKQSTTVPVSVKIRVDHTKERFNAELVKVIREAGADFLVVHGRHWTEHYETPCRHEAIQFFVEELNIPVIGNGDVACVSSLRKMFATGCAGVMLARAGVGQPWLIQKLVTEMRGESFSPPSLPEIGHIFVRHVEELVDLLGYEKFAILQARKVAKYYARSLGNRADFCAAVNNCETLEDFQGFCKKYFIT